MFKASDAFSSYSVDDVGKARELYGSTLGLEVTDDDMGGLELRVGDQRVYLYPKSSRTADDRPAAYRTIDASRFTRLDWKLALKTEAAP